MNKMIAKYDGRQTLLGGALHEVGGRIAGRDAVKLRSPDGVGREAFDGDRRNKLQSIIETLPHYDIVKSRL